MKTSLFLLVFLMSSLLIFTGCPREEVEELIPEQPVATQVTVSIEAPDRILVNGQAMTIDELTDYLRTLTQETVVHARVHATPDVEEEVVGEVKEVLYTIEGVEIHTDEPEYEM